MDADGTNLVTQEEFENFFANPNAKPKRNAKPPGNPTGPKSRPPRRARPQRAHQAAAESHDLDRLLRKNYTNTWRKPVAAPASGSPPKEPPGKLTASPRLTV